jgi:hypothetical protein
MKPLPTTRELLAEYVALISRQGPDSPRAARMVEIYQQNKDFVELAAVSRFLKKALLAGYRSE